MACELDSTIFVIDAERHRVLSSMRPDGQRPWNMAITPHGAKGVPGNA